MPVAQSEAVSKSTGREFIIQSSFFPNGCFIVISEDSPPRIGAISVSISSRIAGKSNTAKVIPSKHDSMFINTISEKISSMTNSICLVSLQSKAPLKLDDMKAIMEVVMDTLDKREKESDGGQQEKGD